MGFFDRFHKPKNKPQTSASQKLTTNNEITRIDREHFFLQLPFRWEILESEDATQLELRNQTLPEQIITTVWSTNEVLADESARRTAVERVVANRLQALREISGGTEEHSAVTWNSGNSQIEARCIGMDQPKSVRFAFVVRADSTKIVTIALTRYFLDEIGHPFATYAEMIFDFLQIKPTVRAPGT